MNEHQKKVLRSWPSLLSNFVRREWISVFLSSGIGVLAAEVVHLVWRDEAFQYSLIFKYNPDWITFDDPLYYIPFLTVSFLLVLLAFGPLISLSFWRGIKSWLNGVTSGLVLLPFVSGFSISMLSPVLLQHRLIVGCGLVSFWFLVGALLHINATVRAGRTILEKDCRVPLSTRSMAGSQLEWSDEPIQTWAQDALGRAALVDSLSVKIMIAKAPVIALSGPLGAGKTSILYLLREHLGDKTITVLFSTWLPGSQETLTSYLLADIASECKKQYVVPGLRQSTRQLAMALGQKVPFLSEYLKLLPEATQKDHINRLRSALLRLPKRVVVLLDELDRMEKDEIMTLLKVIRGIATLPNLSFVCAVDLETLKDTTDKNEEYFQKFFPVVISVPEPNPVALRKTGVDRVVTAFVNLDWFKNDDETEQFRKRIDGVWDTRIAPFCKTLRAVGLLANDVSVAAAPLRREVDPVDLTLIEMLHRFKQPVYKLVAENSYALTGGETLLRGGGLRDEEAEDKARKEFLEDLKRVSPDDFEEVRGVIDELFPLVSKAERQLRRARRSEQSKIVETDIRIREPGIFPAYFRYELPDEIFSSVEMGELLKQLERASSEEARESIFSKALQSMEKGSLKRDDFLRKLADAQKSISPSTAKSLGLAAVKAADKYTYDSAFPTFAEAGHVLRIIHSVAQRLSTKERKEFLQQCILDASDDTMAIRILTILTKQEGDSNLQVSVPDLYQSFVTRMRKRYGRVIDAATIDLTTSDPWAFNLWGSQKIDGVTVDPEDRKIQYDFWNRYIGNSRLRLAQTFRGFFLPFGVYQENPELAVENKIPVADLRRLYKGLPDDPNLTDKDKKSLATLERFLNGEFKNGISPISDLY